eukprot:scaffold2697_cov346-Pavlova_lutheri.AAC.4
MSTFGVGDREDSVLKTSRSTRPDGVPTPCRVDVWRRSPPSIGFETHGGGPPDSPRAEKKLPPSDSDRGEEEGVGGGGARRSRNPVSPVDLRVYPSHSSDQNQALIPFNPLPLLVGSVPAFPPPHSNAFPPILPTAPGERRGN